MIAIAKTEPTVGLTLVDIAAPALRPGTVRVRVSAASLCGTDLHIHDWDEWSSARMQLPRIVGHEFCGIITEVAPDVTDRHVGQFVASESHVVDASSPWMRAGLGHVDPDTLILGVDTDGGFAPEAVIPAANARPVPDGVPVRWAAFLDAFGNAVHTAMDGPLQDQRVLITGLGPIGLFAVAVCRAAGAREIIGVEPSPFRQAIARDLGIDAVHAPGEGLADRIETVDAALEMSGHPASLDLAIDAVRAGGRISLLGVYRTEKLPIRMNDVIFKGLALRGIVGRRLWETWDQMSDLLRSGRLNLDPIITHEIPYTEFARAIELLKTGSAGKIILTFPDPAA